MCVCVCVCWGGGGGGEGCTTVARYSVIIRFISQSALISFKLSFQRLLPHHPRHIPSLEDYTVYR